MKVSWLFDELCDNNASGNGLSLSASVAVNKQILQVILILGNYTMLIIILMHWQLIPTISIMACAL